MSDLEALLNEPHEYQTVVIDSVDWLERLIWDYACQQYRVENIEKIDGGYGKGYTIVLTYWRKFIDALRQLRDPESTTFGTFFAQVAQERGNNTLRMM
ncbi:hypothetical protein FACS18942_09300 [Planctomycetales bacterium]|nr:hypothetical protein FACS18942_09300 [Planctomycetales bacterium]GHT37405.1 hypothetical protein FACS189427_10310 [Planctomycetales bacterium]